MVTVSDDSRNTLKSGEANAEKFAAYNACPSAGKAIVNAVGSNHTGWLKRCRENCSGERV